MKIKLVAFAVMLCFAGACTSNDSHTHDHGDGEHSHAQEEGAHTHADDAPASQEEFTVDADSLKQDSTHTHEDGTEHHHH